MIGLCQFCGPIIGDVCFTCIAVSGRSSVETEGQLDELEACEVLAITWALVEREEERSRRAIAAARRAFHRGRAW